MREPRVSKRKHQQSGLYPQGHRKAGKLNGTQKLGHVIRPKVLERRAAVAELFEVDQARVAEIGVHPKFRHSNGGMPCVATAAWDQIAKQWNADHDVVAPQKITRRKARKRNKTPRAAASYRAARRNAAPALIRDLRPSPVGPAWPIARGMVGQHLQGAADRARKNAKRLAAWTGLRAA